MSLASHGIFENIIEFPDPQAKRRYERLIGLDNVKERLHKEAQILLNPNLLEEWSKKHHGERISLVDKFRERSPLFIFGGDVGTGKTELAATFGDKFARTEDVSVTLYNLSLSARGSGAVGEMTRLISSAFNEVAEAAQKISKNRGKPQGAVILLIDEADAIAQSREFSQMHHEDRAGVNALIRGISNLTANNLPALVVMCTNRLEAIDPAVRRRAADTFFFDRPNEIQRRSLIKSALKDAKFKEEEINELVKITGKQTSVNYGFTFSDITQRLLPDILLDAFPDNAIKFDRALTVAKKLKPTPPFKEQ
jgi:AAA+ superfamily predicted ATPase